MANDNKTPKEVTEVKGIISRRLDALKDTKRVLTMNKGDYNLTLKNFSDSVASFSEMAQSSEGKLLKSEIENLQLTKLQPIPPELMSGQESVAMMHNKFKALTGAIFGSDNLPDVFAGIIKQGCDSVAAEANALISEMADMTAFFKTHVDEICGYLDNINTGNAISMVSKILNSANEINSVSQNMYLNLVKTFNNAKSVNGFSDSALDNIMQQADSLINMLGTEAGKNPAMSSVNFRNYADSLADINYKANNLVAYGEALPGMPDALSNIDINKIYNDNFSNILSSGNSLISMAKNAVNAAESNNAQALTQSVQSIIAQASFIKGQLGQLKKRNIKNIIATGSELLNNFNALAATAENFAKNFPNEAMRIFENDINTIINVTNNLAKSFSSLNRKKPPTSEEMRKIAERLEDKNTQVALHVGELIMGVNGFSAPISQQAVSAIAALKATAPTPLDALARGNVLTFTKTVDNPAMLTRIGQTQEALREIMAMKDITSQELSMLTTLLDFVNGEYERELMLNFVSDLDLQNGLAITSIDKYIDEILAPKQRLLDEYQKVKAARSK